MTKSVRSGRSMARQPGDCAQQAIGRRAFLQHSASVLAGIGTAVLMPGVTFAATPTSAEVSALAPDAGKTLLGAICERILPTTDTPGAVAAGVPDYILSVLQEVYLEAEAQTFLDRLAVFDAQVSTATGTAFAELSATAQDEQLQILADSSDPAQAELFTELRTLTVYGYYTSELGATSETALISPMAPWNGDIAYEDVGKVWTR